MPRAALNDVELYYEDHGAGTPILFCHEFAGDYRSWAPQIRFFARRYRTITYSARGYHPSTVPTDDASYSEERQIEDAFALLGFLRIGKAHVVGLSMGGNLTLKLGLAHPEVCLSLVVAGAGHGSTNPDEFRASSRDTADMIERLGMPEAAAIYARGPGRRQFERKDPAGFAEFLRQFEEHSALGSALTMRNVQAKRATVYQIADRLPVLEIPTLIIVGDEDDLALEPSLLMKRRIPNSGLLTIPKSGHAINLEEPSQFNEALLDFFTAVEQGVWAAVTRG